MPRRASETVVLTREEQAALLSWTRSRTCSQALALRARIVLACSRNDTTAAVAEQLDVSSDTVRKWRSRFVDEGLDGLAERQRPGRPAHHGDATAAEVLVRLLDPPPAGRRWSTRSMAAEVGISQTAVSRIWRTHEVGRRFDPAATKHGSGPTLLPPQIHDVVGLYLDPPVRVLAVATDTGAAGPPPAPGTSARTPAVRRRTAHAREIFAVADAYAQVAARAETTGSRRGDSLRAFRERLDRSVPASMAVHLLVEGLSPAEPAALGKPDHPRVHAHVVAPPLSWLAEVDAVLARNPPPDQENVLGYAASLAGLREQLRAWATTSPPPARPFAWTKSPRSLWRSDENHNGLISASDQPNDARSSDPGTGAAAAPAAGTSRIADRVAELVRDELGEGRFTPGERVKEAPLANRLGVSRGPVREALRVLAEEGMLELLPNRGVAVPHVSADDIVDLYALRASVGGLLVRRIALRPRSELRAVNTALAEVRAVARNNDHAQIGEADLRFQDAIARTAGLPQAGVIFERLSVRLRMFNAVLHLDWAEAVDLIAREDADLHEAVHNADGAEAARRWRVKVERSVRYMVAQLPRDHFDPHLWATLAGKPPLRRSDPAAPTGRPNAQ